MMSVTDWILLALLIPVGLIAVYRDAVSSTKAAIEREEKLEYKQRMDDEN